jgi:hypothetical protein
MSRMTHLNIRASAVLDHLGALAKQAGGATTFDNAPGTYMSLHVEWIGKGQLSVAHYGLQNGDLMRDPDMVFWRSPDGHWYPASYRNDYCGVETYGIAEWHGDTPKKFSPYVQKDQALFANGWMRTLVEQQGLVMEKPHAVLRHVSLAYDHDEVRCAEMADIDVDTKLVGEKRTCCVCDGHDCAEARAERAKHAVVCETVTTTVEEHEVLV